MVWGAGVVLRLAGAVAVARLFAVLLTRGSAQQVKRPPLHCPVLLAKDRES